MPEVEGILETALYVADLDRSEEFYLTLFGWETLLADARMRALSIRGRQVLLLFQAGASEQETPVPGGVIPPHDARGRMHLAFAISQEALPVWQEELQARQIVVESVVHPPLGGTSLYFRDPDGHLVEVATPGIWTIY